VVKVDLGDFKEPLGQGGDHVLVANPDGVIFLSSEPA
jgi:C4-dicarboxylate-specific signal transduction histidine kinase